MGYTEWVSAAHHIFHRGVIGWYSCQAVRLVGVEPRTELGDDITVPVRYPSTAVGCR